LHEIPVYSRCFLRFLPRNRPTVRPEPPGSITDFDCVLGFGMNRLAAMNIYQAAQHCSRFLVCFGISRAGVSVTSGIVLRALFG